MLSRRSKDIFNTGRLSTRFHFIYFFYFSGFFGHGTSSLSLLLIPHFFTSATDINYKWTAAPLLKLITTTVTAPPPLHLWRKSEKCVGLNCLERKNLTNPPKASQLKRNPVYRTTPNQGNWSKTVQASWKQKFLHPWKTLNPSMAKMIFHLPQTYKILQTHPFERVAYRLAEVSLGLRWTVYHRQLSFLIPPKCFLLTKVVLGRREAKARNKNPSCMLSTTILWQN